MSPTKPKREKAEKYRVTFRLDSDDMVYVIQDARNLKLTVPGYFIALLRERQGVSKLIAKPRSWEECLEEGCKVERILGSMYCKKHHEQNK